MPMSQLRRRTLVSIMILSIIFMMPLRPDAAPSLSCCTSMRGNVDGHGIVELSDLSSLVSYLTGGGFVPPCMEMANVNGQGIVDLADLSMLIAYLIGLPATLLPCPVDTTYMSDTVRIAALQAVNQQVDASMSLPIDSFNQHILTFIQGRPEFVASGISPEAGNVWGRFKDGVLLFVSNSFVQSLDTLPGDSLLPSAPETPEPPPQAEMSDQTRSVPGNAALGTADDLPMTMGFRVVSPLGTAYPAASTTNNRLKAWLRSNNYFEVSPLISVFEMKKVGGEALFCYVGHGAAGKTITSDNNNLPEYGIWTSNSAESIDSVRQFADDFKAGRLCYFDAPTHYDSVHSTVVSAVRIGIT
jgi:hypothetical protein